MKILYISFFVPSKDIIISENLYITEEISENLYIIIISINYRRNLREYVPQNPWIWVEGFLQFFLEIFLIEILLNNLATEDICPLLTHLDLLFFKRFWIKDEDYTMKKKRQEN